MLLFVASRDYLPSILNCFSGISGGGGNIHTSPTPTTRPSITTEAPTTACESLFHCWLKFIISLTKGYHFIQRSASKHVQSRRRVLVCNCGEPLGLTFKAGQRSLQNAQPKPLRAKQVPCNLNNSTQWLLDYSRISMLFDCSSTGYLCITWLFR